MHLRTIIVVSGGLLSWNPGKWVWQFVSRLCAGSRSFNCGRGCVPALSTAAERVTRGRRCHVSLDYYSPWRAPGMAPVIDSCGSAGGRLPGQGPGGAGANYQNNSIAHLGMVRRAHGRRLRAEPSPPRATGTSRFW